MYLDWLIGFRVHFFGVLLNNSVCSFETWLFSAYMIHVCNIACSLCPNKLNVWFLSSSVSSLWWSCRVICFQRNGCVGFDWDIPHDHCFIHIDRNMVSDRHVPHRIGAVDQYVLVKCESGMCTNSQTYWPEIPLNETCIHDFIAIIMAPWLVFNWPSLLC